MKRIPLAWLQLTREKRRFVAALAGISFAVAMMLTQLGFENALLSSVALVQEHLAGDLILLSPQYQFALSPGKLTERHLYQTLAIDGVESVDPVYMAQGAFKNPVARNDHLIFMIGFNPRAPLFTAPGVAENLDKIREPGKVLFDSIRRPEFGPVAEIFKDTGRAVTETSGRQVEIVGLYQLGTGFGVDGSLVMSDETFLRILPYRSRGLIDVGLIKLKPGVDPKQMKAKVARLLPPDVRVLTHAEYVEQETAYWTTYTPIGYIFKLGTLMAIFVGCIIVYQILYTDVSDHLPEYATLKAMGYGDWYLLKVVLQESLILSVLGYFPGLLLTNLVYRVSRDATLLPLHMTTTRAIVVYILTALMCAFSAALVARRLRAADPAEIF
jgi:putative ABC transport system permease protein